MTDFDNADRLGGLIQIVPPCGGDDRITLRPQQRNVLDNDLPADPRQLAQPCAGQRGPGLPHQQNQPFSPAGGRHFPPRHENTFRCLRLISRIGAECVRAPHDT